MAHPDDRIDPNDPTRPKSYGQKPPEPGDLQQIERDERRKADEAREAASAQFIAAIPPKPKLSPARFDKTVGEILGHLPETLETPKDRLKAARGFRSALRRAKLKIVEGK